MSGYQVQLLLLCINVRAAPICRTTAIDSIQWLPVEVVGARNVILFHIIFAPLLKVMDHLATLRRLLDRLGATGSLLCALHCALLPLLFALVPSLGLALWLGDGVERALVVFVTLLGMFSLVLGYRRHHVWHALGLLLTGLLALWAGVLYEPWHHNLTTHALVMTLGGSLVGIAHLLNLRLNHVHVHVHGPSCAH
jgi:hypothetical protein